MIGTVTENEAVSWTLTNSTQSNPTSELFTMTGETEVYETQPTESEEGAQHQADDFAGPILAAGGSAEYHILTIGEETPRYFASFTTVNIPMSVLTQEIPGTVDGETYQDVLVGTPQLLSTNTVGGIHTGVLGTNQVQYTTAYYQNIEAVQGKTVFLKTMNLNTGNKVISQSNIKAQTDLQFVPAGEGAIAIGSENLMIDGAGNTTSASDRMLCPFSTQPTNIIPAYCNILQMGSAFQLNLGSVVTSADNRFVGTGATMPVVQNYAINVKGITLSDGTTAPALGSSSAYIKAHIQEARAEPTQAMLNPFSPSTTLSPTKAEDFTYAETSTASGIISSFSKNMQYQSGKSLLP